MNSASSPTRKSILVSTDIHARLEQYSRTTGVSIAHATNEALDDWLATVGAARQQAFKPGKEILQARSNVVTMPQPQAQ